MNNPQKFNIINPKRDSCEALYERVDSISMWRRCLKYRPRVKDFRVLILPRDKIRRVRYSVKRLWSPTPGGVLRKQPVSSSDDKRATKASTASSKATQTSNPEKHLAQNPVPPTNPTLSESLNPFPSHGPTKESLIDEGRMVPEIETALFLLDNTNSRPSPSSMLLNPNHQIGVALTTSEIILNYSNPQQNTHNEKVQRESKYRVGNSARLKSTSSRERLQLNRHTSSFKPQELTGAGLVNISTSVPDYPAQKRKPAVPKRLGDEIEHQPLPRSSSTHNLIQVLEIEASRQEQDMEETK